MTPNWKEFESSLLSTISQYREWQRLLSISDKPEGKTSYGECKRNCDALYNILCGQRTALSLLFPKVSEVQRLTGFILFAGESVSSSEAFIDNIRAEISDLAKLG